MSCLNSVAGSYPKSRAAARIRVGLRHVAGLPRQPLDQRFPPDRPFPDRRSSRPEKRSGEFRDSRFRKALPRYSMAPRSQLAIEAVTPALLDVALEVFEKLCTRKHELDGLHRAQVDRAREEAEPAKASSCSCDRYLFFLVMWSSTPEWLLSSPLIPTQHNHSDLRKAINPAS